MRPGELRSRPHENRNMSGLKHLCTKVILDKLDNFEKLQ